jgi:hypothetical protein
MQLYLLHFLPELHTRIIARAPASTHATAASVPRFDLSASSMNSDEMAAGTMARVGLWCGCFIDVWFE